MWRRVVLDRAFALLGVVVACGGCGTHDPAGSSTTQPLAICQTVDASACPSPMPSYANDIAPLLDRDCNRTCHAPGVGPWPLTDRQSVVDWTFLVVSDIEKCTMPPPDAGTLTTDERKALLDWFACGAPNN